jgi:phytoene synthase
MTTRPLPARPTSGAELDASYRFCAALARQQARNFYFSFVLLPPPLRRSMCALYAFMRHTDDLADGPLSDPVPGLPDHTPKVPDRGAVIDDWRRDVRRALDGVDASAWPGLAALADTVRRHAIPPRYLNEVIDGVAMDLHPHPYDTFDDLHGYCYRVASAVGICCLHIWGYRSEGGRAEELAEACGVALQLTNILRDVREDAENGRLYLPVEDLRRFGVAPEELRAPHPNDRVRGLFAYQAERAYAYYEKARPLAELVDPVGRPVLGTIVGIYRTLLDEIVRRDHDVLAGRVTLPSWRKVSIALRSLSGRFRFRFRLRSRPRARGASLVESPRC